MTEPARPERREALQAAAALALAGATATSTAAINPPQPGPAMRRAKVAQRTPGKPGDFDFLNGHWKIHHLRRRDGADWDAFDGEASCFSLLGGVCSIEELRIPARNFSGMGLRILDVKQQLWQDFWVNAASGLISPSGMPGSFEDGAGVFEYDDEDNGQKITVRGVWDLITPRSCRWQQGVSRDSGASWMLNWSMDWVKVG